jgi:hypothetical protein
LQFAFQIDGNKSAGRRCEKRTAKLGNQELGVAPGSKAPGGSLTVHQTSPLACGVINS